MNRNITEIIEQEKKHAHPIVFLFLILPFGITSGYVTVTLGFLFSKAGISVGTIAGLSAATVFPGVIKFIWAPLVDAFLSLKRWALLSGIVTALGMLAMGILPIKESSIVPLIWIVLAANVAVSFLGIAINGLAAYDIPEELKGRVSGYLNAGNLGGVGLGGGAALFLAEHVSQTWLPAAILAIFCILCSFGLFFLNEPTSTVRDVQVIKTIKNLLKDLLGTLKARIGVLAMVLCFLPLGTGAAQNLWAAISGDWNVSASNVELFIGTMAGIFSGAGCLIGGWICDRSDKRITYVVFGLMQAICAVAMAYCPHIEIMYIFWTSLYAFLLGASYAAFSAFVFEAIGTGAAGTKYTVYASLSNFPIWYMTIIEGWVFDSKGTNEMFHGAKGMLNTEAACGVFGIILFLCLLKYVNSGKKAIV